MLAGLEAWIREPIAVQVAATAPGHAPESARGFAIRLHGESLAVGLVDAQAPRLLAALRSATAVAINLTHPLTFHGRQFKGPLVDLEEPSAEAAEAAHEYFQSFALALAQIGLTAEQCRGMFKHGPTRWVRIRPTEMFNQTPGPGAGARLT
ncbi:MAG TPA: hypothetical protein VHB79_15430 [Polyangiaceae bacterium]|nr:hypothetical protein [Polyangiaceae bacterium]